jgi:hypothetical protein
MPDIEAETPHPGSAERTMLWNYDCPVCRRPTAVDWRLRKGKVVCGSCERTHYPPTPYEDRYAYVDSEQWPYEIEQAVVALPRSTCSVPGCSFAPATLVHRLSPSAGGQTSVDNLMPLCAHHVALKGNRDYPEFMGALVREGTSRKQGEPKSEITITARPPAPGLPAADCRAPSGLALTLASARTPLPLNAAGPTAQPLAELKLAVPFLRGPAIKVALSYDWEMKKSGRCHVFVLAWFRGDEPDLSLLGGPKYAGISIAKDHLGVENEKGSAELELALPESPGGRWTAAVALLDEGCEFQFTEYVLAATS